MKRIFFFLILFILSACAGDQKSNRDYNYLNKDQRAMNNMGKAIEKCISWMKEKSKPNPDPLILNDRPIKFQSYLKNAQKSDPKILSYSNIYKGKTYQQWADECQIK